MTGWQEIDQLERRIVGPVSYPAGYTVEAEVRCLIWLIGLKRATAIADDLATRGHLNAAFCELARKAAGEVALRYPFSMDCFWWATDADGHIGAFVSFQRGPIPLVVLEHEDEDEPLWDYLRALPRRGRPAPGRHEAMPITEEEQGLFMYDWGHGGLHGARNDQYDRGPSAPAVPITIDEIPEPYAEMVQRVQFPEFCFADMPRIDLHQLPPYVPAMPTDDIDI